jgi:hypothetical protein
MHPRAFFVTALAVLTPAVGTAQQPATTAAQLAVLLRPGETVWVTDQSGQEVKGRLLELRGDALQVEIAGQTRSLEFATVRQVEHRHNDALLNGTLIGAAAGGGLAGLAWALWCSDAECDDDWPGHIAGSVAIYTAIGAGVGALTDVIIRGKRTVYEAPAGRAARTVTVSPMVTREVRGVAVGLRF